MCVCVCVTMSSLRLSHVMYLQVVDTLAEIQERHDAVIEVERKLLELQQVWLYTFVHYEHKSH